MALVVGLHSLSKIAIQLLAANNIVPNDFGRAKKNIIIMYTL
jgi:hypothetical protein